MVSESIAILAVCGLLAIALARSKYNVYIISLLPIIVIPVMHLLGVGLFMGVKLSLPWARSGILLAFVDVLALVITSFVIMLLSHRIHSKRYRRTYILCMLIYCLVLGWAFIYNSLGTVLA